MVTPAFSIKHLKSITPVFYEVASRVSRYSCVVYRFSSNTMHFKMRTGIKNNIKGSSKDIDLMHWTHRTAFELIGQGGLGHSFDALEEDLPYTEYAIALKELVCVFAPIMQDALI